jgi:hypothetical protein
LQGIEASPEIQVAARKVADENKRLRTLLAEHGVADDSIEECLKSGSATGPDPLLEGQPGSPRSVGAAYLLDYVLYPGIHDYGYQNVEVPTTMMESDGHSRDHIVPSLWELTRLAQNEHVGRQYEDIYTIAQATSSSHQLITPSSTGTCASMEIFIHDSGCDIQQQQRLGPVAPSSNTIAASDLSRQDPQMFDFEASLREPGQTAYGGDGGTTICALATDPQGVEADLGHLSDEDAKVND